MSIIEEYIPRTIDFAAKKKGAKKKEDKVTSKTVARDIDIFFQAGGHIQDIGLGIGEMHKMEPTKYRAIINSGITIGNQARKKDQTPITKR